MDVVKNILITDDDIVILHRLTDFFQNFHKTKQATLHTTQNPDDAIGLLEAKPIDYLVLDLRFGPRLRGVDILAKALSFHPELPVLIVSEVIEEEIIQKVTDMGASEYIIKPFTDAELTYRVGKQLSVTSLQKSLAALKIDRCQQDQPILTQSAAFQDSLQQLERFAAKGDIDILVVGETGTGKELFCRYAHTLCGKERPFVPINCAAIPKELMESMFFGHEKGAFTGAYQTQIGKLEYADGGDLFLDEISLMPLELQGKLLRVLEDREFERVGSGKPISTHFRVLAATNQDLSQLVEQGKFREDLFYRIAKSEIHIPPLRARSGDIRLLVDHFVKQFSPPGEEKTISPEVFDLLETMPWKGNVRELMSFVRCMLVYATGSILGMDVITCMYRHRHQPVSHNPKQNTLTLEIDSQGTYTDVMRTFEKTYLETMRQRFDTQQDLAKALGLPTSTLSHRFSKLFKKLK